ncbi:hypothetical protein RQP46_006702 [Phenoliferia psychrophenolica]
MPVALPTNEEQWLYSPLELLHTPSIRSGWSPSLEVNTRALAVHRLMCLKDVFQTPQIVVNTAATYLHRFYMRESFHQYAWETLASSSFFLASKVEENQRRLKDVVSVSLDLTAGKQPHPPDRAHPVNESRDGFRALRQRVLYYEEVLLRTLCFDLTVRQPYADMLLAVGKIWPGMDKDGIRRIKAVAHSVITDSLSTTTLLVHRANVIAAASIVIACAQLEIPLPGPPGSNSIAAGPAPEEGEEKEEGQDWVEVLEVKVDDVRDAIERMTAVYEVAQDDFVRDEAARDVPMPDAPPSPTSSNAPIPTPFAFPSPQPPPPPPPPSLPTKLEMGLAPPPDSEDSDMAISPGA